LVTSASCVRAAAAVCRSLRASRERLRVAST
jgi:hypothetical protein